MISFANPNALYLLLVIPVVALIYLWNKISRRKRLASFGGKLNPDILMPEASRYMPNVKIVIELLAVAFIIVALARPYTQSATSNQKEEETTAGIEVMICFDISNSMLASSTNDPGGVSRMQRAKFLLEKLIDKMRNDKVGLIVFAGDAYTQLPITSDYISAKMFLNSITTDAAATQGTAIGAAIEMAINSFSPDSPFKKAILLITDVENFEDNAVEAAKQAASADIQVDVIGIGGDQPMPIPVAEGKKEFIIDQNGEEARTALDAKLGEEIAKAGNGVYITGNAPAALSDITDQLNKLAKTDYKRTLAAAGIDELFPYAIIFALILLLIDTLLPYSKIKWLTKYNFFSKN